MSTKNYLKALVEIAKTVKLENRTGDLNSAIAWAENVILTDDPLVKSFIINVIRDSWRKEKPTTGVWRCACVNGNGSGWINMVIAIQMYRAITRESLVESKEYVEKLLSKMERHVLLGEDL